MERQTAIVRENFLDSVIDDDLVPNESMGHHYFEAARAAPDANLRLLS